MKITPQKVNSFMFFKLPLAYLGGVRVASIAETESIVNIKHRWINQNPYKSMFWAAQGMAAEMTTGVLVMSQIEKSNRNISMLVTHQEAKFTKKATGKIQFICKDGGLIKDAIQKSIDTGEGQAITLTSEGFNKDGVSVSKFQFEWSLKVKK
jgi:hypothetical protein